VAYLAVGAPVGEHADWTARAALTQGDIASWIVAGEYTTRAPARHRYDLGLSYSTQRYDGGNVAARRSVTDGSRNAGAIYGFDTFSITPRVTLTYGGRYARYDYLDDRSLLSSRVSLTLQPAEHFRISTMLSHREVAPGAEEFMPRIDGIWLPPQRTFSSLLNGQSLEAERNDHVEVEIERDLASSTLSIRAFRQHVSDQLTTLFGVDMPGAPAAHLGHYFVHNSGNVDASGLSAGLRTAIASRVHGTVEYSLTRAQWEPSADIAYMLFFAPSAVRTGSERIHDLSTSIETAVPETSTHVIVLYRVSNGFAHQSSAARAAGAFVPAIDRPELDARFDVQVRQSLPFMDFSSAKWEMLLAVRNFFRDAAADQSVYDELLVVRPPKRIVGGLTLKF
jgi:outer membrane receptor protein involved in Fe transport